MAEEERTTVLPQLIKELMVLNEETTALNAALREKRARTKAVNEMIYKLMKGTRGWNINTTSAVLLAKTKPVKSSLSKKYIINTLTTFFNGDAARAEACMQFLEQNRTVKEVDTIQIQPKH